MVEAPGATRGGTAPPQGLPADFVAQYKGAERALGELLKALVQSASSDLHLRVGEPPVFRTHGEMKRQATPPPSPPPPRMGALSGIPPPAPSAPGGGPPPPPPPRCGPP